MPRVIITTPGGTPQPYRFQLDRKVVTLGRGSTNDIVIDCPSVSVVHAEMRRVEGGYELRDLESTNGIKFEGQRLEVIPLHDGQSAQLGDVTFDFTLSDEEKELLGHERPLEETPILREPAEEKKLPPLPEAPPPVVQELADEGPERRVGCAWWVLLVVFVVIGFILGMAIRHQRETGSSLWESLQPRSEQPGGGSKQTAE
jgi:pSer/pThr/pTyr-binding forkhead associated (FHA) protein